MPTKYRCIYMHVSPVEVNREFIFAHAFEFESILSSDAQLPERIVSQIIYNPLKENIRRSTDR